MKERSGVYFYREEDLMLRQLTDAEIGQLFKAKTGYAFYGEVPDFPENSKLALMWIMLKSKADYDGEKYAAKCKSNALAAKKKNDIDRAMKAEFAKAHGLDESFFRDADDTSMQTDANACECMQTVPTTTPAPAVISTPSPFEQETQRPTSVGQTSATADVKNNHRGECERGLIGDARGKKGEGLKIVDSSELTEAEFEKRTIMDEVLNQFREKQKSNAIPQ